MIREWITCIRKWMLTAQSRQKSYTDKHRCIHGVAVGDLVYPKCHLCEACDVLATRTSSVQGILDCPKRLNQQTHSVRGCDVS